MRTFLIGLLASILILTVACRPAGTFAPGQATQTPSGVLTGEPVRVSFPELDADPAAYRNQLIRVSGIFQRLPEPECARWRGPDVSWSLIDEGLQMEATGYDSLLRLLPSGVPLTVDGFWRLYEGPLGCGKEPPMGSAWYLEAIRLVQPNPLPLTGDATLNGGPSPRELPGAGATPAGDGGTPLPTTAGTAPPPGATAAPTATPGGGLQPPGTATRRATATASPAPAFTPTPSPTRASGGAFTPTPSPSRPGVATLTPRPTSTPGGYPAPAPSPTATLDPYSGP